MGDVNAAVRVYTSVFEDLALGSCTTDGGACDHLMDCVVSSVNPALYDGVTRSLHASPQLRDAPNGDYHLRPTSPAIDFCDGAVAVPTAGVNDVDDNSRAVDLPTVANEHGFYDAGADEVTALELITLFSDGFELGNTALWSDTVD